MVGTNKGCSKNLLSSEIICYTLYIKSVKYVFSYGSFVFWYGTFDVVIAMQLKLMEKYTLLIFNIVL